MTDKQIIIDETKINLNDFLEPYKPIPAYEIKDCDHLVYVGNDVYGCRIAEDGLVCDDFNNDDECCMYRQLEYYKEALKAKEQECEELKAKLLNLLGKEGLRQSEKEFYEQQLDQLKAENENLKVSLKMFSNTLEHTLKAEVGLYKRQIDSSVPDDWEYEEVLVLVEEYIEKLKAENEELKDLNTRLDNQRETYWKEYQKLKQTLAEIKELMKIEIECKTYEIENDCFNETRCKALKEHIDFTNQILQKISECEVNNGQ